MELAELKRQKIAIVGPCSSGKSTLKRGLQAEGYLNVRNPTQEHSYVPDMWKKITNPDILIYLDVDYPSTLERRPHIDLGPERVVRQNKRLAHAREHSDFYIDTSKLTPDEITTAVVEYLNSLV